MAIDTLTVLRGSVRVPTSKPHTQRAILMATLADGESVIRRPNDCSESTLLLRACTELGARFTSRGEHLVVQGVGGKPRRPASVLDAFGSGFALRHLLAIAALAQAPCVLTGSRRLASRPVLPLLDALGTLGCRIEPVDATLVLPVISWSTGIVGGEVEVPGAETSQFISALMLAAPCAERTVHIRVPGELVSQHYIRMTLDMMTAFGADVDATTDLRAIDIRPRGYQPRDVLVGPDVTSLFYFIAAAVVADTDIVVEDVVLDGDPFLDAAIAVGRRLGVTLSQEDTTLRVTSGAPPTDRVRIDASNIPTLVPALAAVASSLPNGVLLTNARHIQHHKTNRLQVVLNELERMGRVLRPRHRVGQLDGFETATVRAATAESVDSHGDHRNFMALFLASLAAGGTVPVIGAETLHTSFAGFHDCFRKITTSPARA